MEPTLIDHYLQLKSVTIHLSSRPLDASFSSLHSSIKKTSTPQIRYANTYTYLLALAINKALRACAGKHSLSS